MKKWFSILLLLPFIASAQLVDHSSMNAQSTVIGFYRVLTIDHTKVPNTDQANFAFPLSGTYSYLATPGHGGKMLNASAFDFSAALDSFGSQKLNWDIEQYDSTTGKITVWIKANLSHTVDTRIYIKYGVPGINSYQGNRGAVWDPSTLLCYHFADVLTAPGQTIADATSNGNNAVSQGTWTSGQQSSGPVGGALSLLNANGDYMSMTPTTLSGSYTVEGWFNITVQDNTTIGPGAPVVAAYGPSINFFGGFGRLFGGISDIVADATTTPINTWVYLAFTVNGANAIAYHNGVQTATSTAGGNFGFQWFGRQGFAITQDEKGDEFRVSTTQRSPDWIMTNYNAQSSPSTFYSIGSEL